MRLEKSSRPDWPCPRWAGCSALYLNEEVSHVREAQGGAVRDVAGSHSAGCLRLQSLLIGQALGAPHGRGLPALGTTRYPESAPHGALVICALGERVVALPYAV